MPLSPEKITVLIERITTVLKAAANKPKKDSKGKSVFRPCYSEYYERTVELADEAAVHADGCFPEKLLRTKAPNEDPKEFEYRKGIYEPRTKAYWEEAQSVINRIWNEQNYSITWPEDKGADSDTEEESYFLKELPKFKSIKSFFPEIVTPWKLKDPNAVIAIRPVDIPMKEDQDEAGDTILINDDTQFIEPGVFLFESKRVIEFVQEKYALLLTHEKSEIEKGGKKVKEGLVYELYDDMVIYRINQFGKWSDFTFERVIFYPHNTEILPVYKLKGRPVYFGDDILFLSYFSSAIPNLNVAVRNGSTLDMIVYDKAFPRTWEYVEVCPGENGFPCTLGDNQKFVINDESTKGFHICNTCHGTGSVNKRSPLGVTELKVPERLNPNDFQVPTPPFGDESPSTEIFEFLLKIIERDTVNGFAFLNLDVSNSDVQPTQDDTAIGKKIDREELFSFLLLISNELFDLLKNCINIIGLMRYGTGKWKEPEIKFPTDFAIRSESDLTEELSSSYENNIPDIAKRAILKQYTGIRFNSAGAVEKMNDITLAIDRLATKKELEINSMLSVGRAAKWEAVLHDSIAIFLMEKVDDDPDYLGKDMAVIKAELVAMAKELSDEINAAQVTSETIMGTLTQTGSGNGKRGATNLNGAPSEDTAIVDELGKLPLGLQQLGLASQRAIEAGNTKLAKAIQAKMFELTKAIDVAPA